jgi:hypothetical protein
MQNASHEAGGGNIFSSLRVSLSKNRLSFYTKFFFLLFPPVMSARQRSRKARVHVQECIGELEDPLNWLQQQALWSAWNEHFVWPDAARHGPLVAPIGPRQVVSTLFYMPPLGNIPSLTRKRRRIQSDSDKDEDEDEDDEVTREILAAQAELKASWHQTQPTKIRLTHLLHATRGHAVKLHHLDRAERTLEMRYLKRSIPPKDALDEFHKTLQRHGISSRADLNASIPRAPSQPTPALSPPPPPSPSLAAAASLDSL